ncbi:MAG: hypothetical protein ABI867_24455 [Kofleriaceae bacterium]
MRAWLAIVVLSGCGGMLDSRPAVVPKLSELPDDPGKRDAILDQSQTVPGPEMRKNQTKKERRAETGAAIGAAILGQIFSTTENTVLGVSTVVEIDTAVEPIHPTVPAPAPRTNLELAPGQLLPWMSVPQK